jgi:prepilin-type N-terminal cleavage/methylation domain-containing protein
MSFVRRERSRPFAKSPRAAAVYARRGFSLVELLTVLAIMGALSAIIVPSMAAARGYALRMKTKVQFAQWTGAMDQFRQEYGFYPPIDGGSGGKVVPVLFAGALTGRTVDGMADAAPANLAGNTRALSFYVIGEGEVDEGRTHLRDAWGNGDIAVLYDRNGDGVINDADGAVVAVSGGEADVPLSPPIDELDLGAGLRAGVIFYSAGRGEKSSDLVYSWK